MSFFQYIALWIPANSALLGPFILLVTFLGSLLGTNLVVPAGAILTAFGVLIGAGVISWTAVLWGIFGACLGMSASYSIGLRLGPRVQEIPLLRAGPQLLERARLLFERYGFASILIGYFCGPLRAAVACVAAFAGMTRASFELANVTSSIVWAFAIIGIGVLPGTMIGANSVWLFLGPIFVPVITIGISVGIWFLRSTR